jgi:putative transposase
MTAEIALTPGCTVSWKGKNYVIEDAEDLERLLVRSAETGRREFIPTEEVGLPMQATCAGQSAEEALPEEAAVGASGGKWRQALGKRQIRRIETQDKVTVPDALKINEKLEENKRHFAAIRRVAELARYSSERAEATERLATEWGYSRQTAYRKVAIVEAQNDADALERSVREDKGKLRLSKGQWDLVKSTLDQLRFVPQFETIPQILVTLNKRLADAGHPKVSERTLYLAEKRLLTARERLLKQGRKDEVRNLFGSHAGSLPDANFPLSIVQIDHTTVQIKFVDSEHRMLVGDATLTLVIDCFSRMVLGYYLSFEKPSTLSAGMALANAFLPKERTLRRLGVKGSWPCWGYPVVVIVDNAAEFNGHMIMTARSVYKFDIRDRPVNGPQFGGTIERAFRTFMATRKTVKGTMYSNPQERAGRESESIAEMTLDEFDQYFCEYLINDYHLDEHDGDGMKRRAPIQRWNDGIFRGDIMAPTGLPARPADEDQVRISFLPIERKAVSNLVVQMHNLKYYSKRLGELSLRQDPSRPLESRLHEVRWDPRNIAYIWVRDPQSGEYIEAKVQNVPWTSRSIWEHEAERASWGRPAAAFEDERAESKERQREIKRISGKKTKEAQSVRKQAERSRRNQKGAIKRGPTKKEDKGSLDAFARQRQQSKKLLSGK